MSSLINIFGEYDRVRVECADDEPCIWIRTDRDAVSLSLTREQRAALRLAIDAADELDAPLPTVFPAQAAIESGTLVRDTAGLLVVLADDMGGRP